MSMSTDPVFVRIRLLLGLALSMIALSAAAQPWEKLDARQRGVLAPFASSWNALPEEERHKLLGIAEHYPELAP